MPFRKPGIQTPEGESGEWKRVQGRHVFVPTAENSAEEVGENEIERWAHPTPTFKNEDDEDKTKFVSVEDHLDVRNIHADGAKEGDTYIGEPAKEDKLPDKNKVADVQLQDKIKYYLNGEEGQGYVIAMTGGFFTVRKDTGGYQDIMVSDIFFVESILTEDKSWAHMSVDERTEILQKARCPLSFVTRNWDDMPPEVVAVIKSNFESGKYGGIDTSTHFDATEDYEAVPIIDDKENFKHENQAHDISTTEPEDVPESNEHPEVSIKDGKMQSPMIAGTRKDDDIDPQDDGKKKIIGAVIGAVETNDKTHLEEEDKGNQNEDYIGHKKTDREDVEDLDKDGKKDNQLEEKPDDKDKENASMGTGDSGSFNSVHNSRFNSDDDRKNHIGKMVGIAKSYSGYGVTYGKETTEEDEE